MRPGARLSSRTEHPPRCERLLSRVRARRTRPLLDVLALDASACRQHRYANKAASARERRRLGQARVNEAWRKSTRRCRGATVTGTVTTPIHQTGLRPAARPGSEALLCRSRNTRLTGAQRRRDSAGRVGVGGGEWAREGRCRSGLRVSAGDHQAPNPLWPRVTRSCAGGSGRGGDARWRDGRSSGLEDLIHSVAHLARLLTTRLDALVAGHAIDLFVGLQRLQPDRVGAARARPPGGCAEQRYREGEPRPPAFRRNCRPEGGGRWRLHVGLPRPCSFRGRAAPRRGTFGSTGLHRPAPDHRPPSAARGRAVV